MKTVLNIGSRTSSGIMWSFIDLVLNQGLQFVFLGILARLLTPDEFGIIGITLIFIALAQSVINSGLSSALIRDTRSTQVDYSTIFYVNLLIAAVLYLLMYFLANDISVFFNEPPLEQILKVLSLIFFINAFGLIQRTLLTKKVEFKSQTVISIISAIVSGVVSIILAIEGLGIWSLVVRMILLQFLQSLLLSLHNKWVPSLVFSWDSFTRLFGFGWKLLVSGIIDTLYRHIYVIIIGKAFSTTQVGYYSNAQQIRDAAAQSITGAIQRVSYPILSAIQDEEERLKSSYKRIILNAVYITFPVMVGLAVIAPSFIRIVLGDQWDVAVPYLQILCLAGMLYPLHALNLNMLQVKGRSDLFLGLEIIKKLISIAVVAGILFFGLSIMVLLWAAVINSVISYFINSYYSGRLLSYSTKDQIKDILPALILSVIMGVSILVCTEILPGNEIVRLILQVTLGFLIYIGCSIILKVPEFYSIFRIIKSILLTTKRKNKAS